ncbi:homeobox protein CDX-4-like [Lissotriton helveticus]
MYLSYFGDKENDMYPGSVSSTNNSLPIQNFAPTQPYAEYAGYHHPVPQVEEHSQSSGGWGPNYGLPRDDWSAYGPGMPSLVSASMPGHIPYGSHEYSPLYPAGTDLLPMVDTRNVAPISASTPRPHPFVWMRKTAQPAASGKTRTREKYRVVYTDHQRQELEKEFLSNRYITIRRKSELAAFLGLSDRQVKIWFQNRRAKERKLMKKTGQFEGSGGSVQSDSGSAIPTEMSKVSSVPPHVMNNFPPTDNMRLVTVSQ